MAKNAATKENTALKTVSSKKSKKYIPEMRLGHEEVLERDVELRVLSLGAGVQSSTLLFKVLHEEIAPVDIAIFADTGNEPKEVYKHLHKLMDMTTIPIKIVQESNIVNDVYEDKFNGFIEDLTKVGNKMDAAKVEYEDAMKKLYKGHGNLISRVENLKKMGAKAKKSLPDTIIKRADESDKDEQTTQLNL